MRCLVTGSTGFIARVLLERLKPIHTVTAASRKGILHGQSTVQMLGVGDINQGTDWERVLSGQEVVIHLAGRAHVSKDSTSNPLAEYRRVNVEGTASLARQAVKAGVQRFIFISSIKVNGEITEADAFRYDNRPNPQDSYALSKWEAEKMLSEICRDSEMELVIIRPPLVYGPGVKGNLLALKKAIVRGFPLPLANTQNRRDLISLDNLVDLILACVNHPKAAGEIFLCSDARPVSTTELVERMAEACGGKARLFRLPRVLLKTVAVCLGKREVYSRLFQDLRIDINHTKAVLGWEPPFTFDESILKAFDPDINESAIR